MLGGKLVFSSKSTNKILMKMEEIHRRTRSKRHSKNTEMVKPEKSDGSLLRVSQGHFSLDI